MYNKKFCMVIWICLIFLIAKSADAIVINEIMYAPLDDWGGMYNEWIELYNNDMETVNLTGWTIDGKTIPETIIHSGEYLIIAKDDIKFNEFYPNVSCDVLKVAILLTNSGETITLNDTTSTIIDSIDYTGYASDGWGYKNNKTLERNTTSGWKESSVNGGTPGFKNSVSNTSSEQNQIAEPKIISIYVNVIGQKPSINNISISPDYYNTEGFQVMPNAGENKEITISVVVGDDDSIDNIVSVTTTINSNEIELLRKETISEYEAIYEGKANMSFYDAPGTYTIEVKTIDSSSSEDIKTSEFEYLELLAVDINFDTLNFDEITTGTNKSLDGSSGLTIQNIGNLVSDLEISGTDLTTGEEIINISNLQYQFSASSFVPLLNNPAIADINLIYGESSYENMNLKLHIPEETKIGSYSGSITITAIAD